MPVMVYGVIAGLVWNGTKLLLQCRWERKNELSEWWLVRVEIVLDRRLPVVFVRLPCII